MSVEEAQEFIIKADAFFKRCYDAHLVVKKHAAAELEDISTIAYRDFYCDILEVNETLEAQQAQIEDLQNALKASAPQNLYDELKFETMQELLKVASLEDLETFLKCKTHEI